MSEIKWSDSQKKAIFDRDKGIVVSAAAGSGKTTVLIERIIQRITDKENPLRLDRLLVVTFTRAAAGELGDRLRSEIAKRLADNPSDRMLLRQQKLLPMADLCNIDSFFNSLVRQNFNDLGISPDFRIEDRAEEKILKNEAAEQVLENAYETGSKAFRDLLAAVGGEQKENNLKAIIISLSENADSHISPEKWLNSVAESYSGSLSVEQTQFGKVILDNIRDRLSYGAELLEKGINLCKDCEGLEAVYEKLCGDYMLIQSLIKKVDEKKWDELKEDFTGVKTKKLLSNFPSVRGELGKCPEKLAAQRLYEVFRDSVFYKLEGAIPATGEEYKSDLVLLYPAVCELVRLVFEFREAYTLKKSQANAFDFNDITHLVLKLLIDEDSQPTELALELRNKYDEILIDEYQDTNEAQDAIFTVLSRNQQNLFLVGDVKQSVYAFRLAMPEIFIDKIRSWKNPENELTEYVNLDCNYRSRKAILDFVNLVFKKSMSEKTGGLEYTDEESLKHGFDYPTEDSVGQVEIDIIDEKNAEDYSEEALIADKIKMIVGREQVYDKKLKAMRPAKLGDICILCRKNDRCEQIAKHLRENGISAYFEEKKGFFSSIEINTAVSFLKIIDNPLQDIPLISVLMSPIFGFDADDLARLRVEHRNGLLWGAVRDSDSEKCKNFINAYERFRRLSSVMSVSSLIREIYEQTGYYTVVGAMAGGEIRKLNLIMLLEYAGNYESYSDAGLSGFLRYLDDCRKSKAEFRPAVTVSENADVVNVMTVHKSKGLEFPIVFLPNARLAITQADDLIVNEKLGLGLKVSDTSSFRKYETVQYRAAAVESFGRDFSEQMRLLYVALTRAKERLIVVSSFANVEKKLPSLAYAGMFEKLNPVEVRNTSNYAELILKTLYTHHDADVLRNGTALDLPIDSNSEARFKVSVITSPLSANEDKAEESVTAQADTALTELIREKALYKYPYLELTKCVTKKAASAFNADSLDALKYFADDVPQFADNGKLNAAQRGTAMHRFMEICDFRLASKNLEEEISRAVLEGGITRQQADSLDRKALCSFFDSEIFRRMEASDGIMREQKFTVFVPAAFDNPHSDGVDSSEKILVQGVIDCAFYENGKLVVLDYKTDRVENPQQLREMYSRQLEIYRIAAQQSFNTEVSQLLLYSFALCDTVEL